MAWDWHSFFSLFCTGVFQVGMWLYSEGRVMAGSGTCCLLDPEPWYCPSSKSAWICWLLWETCNKKRIFVLKYWLSTEVQQAHQSKCGFTYVQGAMPAFLPISATSLAIAKAHTRVLTLHAHALLHLQAGHLAMRVSYLQQCLCPWSGMTYVLVYLSSSVHLLFIDYRSLWAILLCIALPVILYFFEGAGVVMSRPNRIPIKYNKVHRRRELEGLGTLRFSNGGPWPLGTGLLGRFFPIFLLML